MRATYISGFLAVSLSIMMGGFGGTTATFAASKPSSAALSINPAKIAPTPPAGFCPYKCVQ